MVFFLCNHCGDSAKKNSVEKHFNTRCRGAPISVSCMDCQKDFHGTEYIQHTTCITELEKYSGKDYVPKASLNKGQRKQDSWLEIVRSILNSSEYHLNRDIKIIFERLQTYDNVPRKKLKFENFVANSLCIQKNKASEVWQILEKELQKIKSNNQAQAPTPIPNGTNDVTDKSNQTTTETIPETSSSKTEKSKSSKKRSMPTNETNGVICSNGNEMTEISTKKKKKSTKTTEIKECENEVVPLSASVTESTDIPLTATNMNEFDWSIVIMECVQDGMSVEKLQKKVLKKYKKTLGESKSIATDKSEKKFRKYLKKSGLNLENNIIKVGA